MSDVPDWARDRFQSRVVPALFSGVVSTPDPTLILIGGQPGAGKTWAMRWALDSHPHESITPVIGDDLRIYHPDYDRLMATDPMRMPEITADASALWVEASLEHARHHQYGVLVEGTFRRPEVTLGTASRFRGAGYSVHMIAVAVPPWESRLSTLERFVIDHGSGRAARWTPVDAHDAGVAGTPRTLSAAAESPDVQRITIINRSGMVLFDAGGPEPRNHAAAALRKEHRRTPSQIELANWRSRLISSRAYLEANVPTSDQTKALLGALHRDSVSLGRRVGSASGSSTIPPQRSRGQSIF